MGVFLDLYRQIPATIRTLLSLVVIGIGLYYAYLGWQGHNAIKEQAHGNEEITYSRPGSDGQLFAGMGTVALGCILLTLAGKSDSEKAGYNSV